MSSTFTTRMAYAAFAAVCLLWGTTYLAIRIALETIPPMLLAGMRWTAAGALILGVMRARGEHLPPIREWPALSALGVALIGFGNGGVVWAEQTVPSGLTAVLVAVVPFWMVAIELFAGARDLGRWQLAGLMTGFAGIVLLVWPELEWGRDSAFLAGVAATQLACLGWALGSSYSRRRGAAENVLAAAAFQMLFGGVVMLAVGALAGERSSLTFNARTASALGYLLVFGSIAGFSAYAYALKYLPVATVSLYAYVNPVIAVALGTLILGEPLSPRLAVAGAIVLIGMAMVKRVRPSRHEQLTTR